MKKYDVIIAGGGISGFFAAVSAARNGLERVLLVEATNTIGGIVVEGPLEALMTFHDENGLIASELVMEFLDRLFKREGSPGFVEDSVGYCRTIVPYNREIIQSLMLEVLYENKIEVLLNTLVIDTNTSGVNISSVKVINKGGFQEYFARVFVNATGDGELAFLSGANVMMGRESDGKVQPMTMLFRVAGVDTNSLREYVLSQPGEFRIRKEALNDLSRSYLHIWGFGSLLKLGYDTRRLSLFRTELQAMVLGDGGDVVINYTRCNGDPLNPFDISQAQITTQRQAFELLDFLKEELPFFSHASVSHTGRIGIRESRRIRGKYLLTIDDLVNPKEFGDTVARGAFPVDIHQPDGNSLVSRKLDGGYNIPAGVLQSKDFGNLFMCGRCISASHEAMASTRITGTSMETGRAAGELAAGKNRS